MRSGRILWKRLLAWGWCLVLERRRRRELDGWLEHFGLAGHGRMAAACYIARRCAGAEAALKRLAEAAEREAAEAGLPGLTPAEIERLALLVEECGSVAKVVGKLLRHGWEGRPGTGKTYRVALERELGDVRAIVGLMLDARDVRLADIQHWQKAERVALRQWTRHQ